MDDNTFPPHHVVIGNDYYHARQHAERIAREENLPKLPRLGTWHNYPPLYGHQRPIIHLIGHPPVEEEWRFREWQQHALCRDPIWRQEQASTSETSEAQRSRGH
ncbi:MAG: hypothetical protein R3320_11080 [Nitriliruptorales bacterium]|nr:hypothetical protein [Nitriliruptorales bacterium]